MIILDDFLKKKKKILKIGHRLVLLPKYNEFSPINWLLVSFHVSLLFCCLNLIDFLWNRIQIHPLKWIKERKRELVYNSINWILEDNLNRGHKLNADALGLLALQSETIPPDRHTTMKTLTSWLHILWLITFAKLQAKREAGWHQTRGANPKHDQPATSSDLLFVERSDIQFIRTFSYCIFSGLWYHNNESLYKE